MPQISFKWHIQQTIYFKLGVFQLFSENVQMILSLFKKGAKKQTGRVWKTISKRTAVLQRPLLAASVDYIKLDQTVIAKQHSRFTLLNNL